MVGMTLAEISEHEEQKELGRETKDRDIYKTSCNDA